MDNGYINAKAYTELINRLEDVKDAIKKQNYGIAMEILCKPYPQFQVITHSELKESEDEKIRKQITGFITYSRVLDETKKIWLAWLEKQGAHAEFLDKIQIGDKVTRNEDGVLVNLSQLKRVVKPAENKGEHDMGISEATKKKLEDNLNKALEKETPESWNKFIDEQKPAWSEEDETGLTNTIIMLKEGASLHFNKKDITKAVDWLKSIKDRYTWKPSDEQMNAINDAIDYLGCNTKKVREYLMSLHEQLKKLRGE